MAQSETKFTAAFMAQQRELAERATERPWYYGTYPDQQDYDDRVNNPLTGKEIKIIACPGDGSHIMGIFADGKWSHQDYYEKVDVNSEYMTAAANHYPDALAEIERLRAENDSLRARAERAEQDAERLAEFGLRIRKWLAKGNPEPMWYEDFMQAVNDHEQDTAQP
jgi:hypothetical protein